MKILFVNDQYERGGAGCVAAILANQLYQKGYDIILVHDFQNWEPTYYIDDGIPKRGICTKAKGKGVFAKIARWWNCIRMIRLYIKEEKPDIIIATQATMFLCCYISNLFLKVPIIAADHTSFTRRINPLIDFVRYNLYSKSNGLSILTEKDSKILGDKYPNKQVIYNPCSFPILERSTVRRKRILCVGRLEVWDVKGFDIIIAHKYPDWTLEIAGPGDATSILFLEKMISDYNLSSCLLLGQIDNMKELYSTSEIFVLPSRVEGFPMVLMEALSQGCSCIAFEVGGATYEMLEEGAGVIVKDGDNDTFRDALVQMIEHEEQRKIYSLKALQSVQKFSVDRFVKAWEELLYKTYNKNIKSKRCSLLW